MNPKEIVIIVDWFDPAYKAGGPVSSMVNLTKLLGGDFKIKIITSDTDYGITKLDGVETDKWVDWHGKAMVYYLSEKNRSRSQLFDILDETEADFYYIQGMFSLYYSVLPLLWWKKRKIGQAIVAPRGMLHPNAFEIKRRKKQVFLETVKLLGWYDDIFFHATNEYEKERIIYFFKRKAARRIRIANNVPKILVGKKECVKKENELKVIAVGRISKEKNYELFFEIFSQLDVAINLTIVGDYSDDAYFENFFKPALESLESKHKVEWIRNLAPHELQSKYQESDLFISTSFGENYGHAIAEALGNGCPVLIPETLPWHKLDEKLAGYNLKYNAEMFNEKIKYFYTLSLGEFSKYCRGAFAYYQYKSNFETLKDQYKNLFNE